MTRRIKLVDLGLVLKRTVFINNCLIMIGLTRLIKECLRSVISICNPNSKSLVKTVIII